MAWIADGLDPSNPDFIRDGKSIFKDYVDFSGNSPDTQTGGEEAFGDASMIAAQGNETYDLSDYNSPAYPLPRNCDIKIEGMAPGASLIGLKAGGEFLATSAILQSIDYAILIVADPVSGAEVSQAFRGTIGFNEARVSSNLPASASTKLTAGQAANYTISYANPGSVPEPVQVDPRLRGTTSVVLPSLSGTPTVTLPLSPANAASVPFYEVPPGTSQLSVAATSSTPAQLELAGPLGEPDVFGDLGAARAGDLTSVARVTEAGGRHQVARGFWGTFVQQIGPFTDAGAPAGTSTLTATALTQPLDPAVTSAAGDPYAPGFTDQAPTGTPVVVNPGASAGITVTITPSAKAGTVVHGVIYLVTSPFSGTGTIGGAIGGGLGAEQTSGDVLAALPYAYTVG